MVGGGGIVLTWVFAPLVHDANIARSEKVVWDGGRETVGTEVEEKIAVSALEPLNVQRQTTCGL